MVAVVSLTAADWTKTKAGVAGSLGMVWKLRNIQTWMAIFG